MTFIFRFTFRTTRFRFFFGICSLLGIAGGVSVIISSSSSSSSSSLSSPSSRSSSSSATVAAAGTASTVSFDGPSSSAASDCATAAGSPLRVGVHVVSMAAHRDLILSNRFVANYVRDLNKSQ